MQQKYYMEYFWIASACQTPMETHGVIYRRHQDLGRPNKIYVYDLLKADNSNWLPKQIMFGKGNINEKEVL